MLTTKIVKTLVMDTILPWIIKHIWPSLEQVMKEYLLQKLPGLFSQATQKTQQWFAEWSANRKNQANQAAEQAQQFTKQAEQATSAADAEKFMAIAQIWREVAEVYRRELEDVKAGQAKMETMLTELRTDTEKAVKDSGQALDVNKLVEEKSKYLALPPGKETSL